MGTRSEQRDATRARILKAALAAFNAHGYQGASTRSITKAANVSPGLLFHYFPSKAELYTELVRIGFRELRVDPGESGLDPLAFLTATAERVIGLLCDHDESADMFVFMNYVGSHPGFVADADALMEAHDLVRRTVPVLAEGQQRGDVRSGSSEALAVAFWSALQGIAMEVAANPDRPLPDHEWIVDIVRNRSET